MTPDPSRSLGHRLRNAAAERGVEASRLRRHLVFHRILARLALDGRWVLKGGFCLEVRLALAGRATQDLDLALRGQVIEGSTLELQDLLAEALQEPSLGDGFAFEVAMPTRLPSRDLGQPGWRVKVRAVVGGLLFEEVKLDVVEATPEIEGGVEVLRMEPLLPHADSPAVEIPAVVIAQHAAEKVHAYARTYAQDRPSSRVKDLVDLVLLVEAGLIQPGPLAERLVVVFQARDGTRPPPSLPPPPASWAAPYAAMAVELALAAMSSADAWRAVDRAYEHAVHEMPSQEGRT